MPVHRRSARAGSTSPTPCASSRSPSATCSLGQDSDEPPIPAAVAQAATAKRRRPADPPLPHWRIPRSMQRTTRYDLQGAHEVATLKQTDRTTYALRSLVGIEALSLLTSIHHLDELGVSFLMPAV